MAARVGMPAYSPGRTTATLPKRRGSLKCSAPPSVFRVTRVCGPFSSRKPPVMPRCTRSSSSCGVPRPPSCRGELQQQVLAAPPDAAERRGPRRDGCPGTYAARRARCASGSAPAAAAQFCGGWFPLPAVRACTQPNAGRLTERPLCPPSSRRPARRTSATRRAVCSKGSARPRSEKFGGQSGCGCATRPAPPPFPWAAGRAGCWPPG